MGWVKEVKELSSTKGSCQIATEMQIAAWEYS